MIDETNYFKVLGIENLYFHEYLSCKVCGNFFLIVISVLCQCQNNLSSTTIFTEDLIYFLYPPNGLIL